MMLLTVDGYSACRPVTNASVRCSILAPVSPCKKQTCVGIVFSMLLVSMGKI